MDLPPSGWYPDPYGTPDLLRWWDGLNWTRHTHPGVDVVGDTGGGGVAASAAAGAAAAVANGAHSNGRHEVAQTTVQGAAGGWAASDRVIDGWAGTDWPTGDQLATTKPPKGPRTEPQPALPETSVQESVQSSAAATRYQPAVQPTTTQAAVQPTAYQQPVQATTVQPGVANGWGTAATTVDPAVGAANGAANGQQGGGAGGDGTQVLFLGGDAWQTPGGADGTGQGNYGYQEAQRRRRLLLIGGISGATAVAIAIIVVVANSMGGSPSGTAAAQSPLTPTASPTPSVLASPSVAASSAAATPPASVLSDGQSGLSYTQLGTPWQTGCPSGLSSAFAWTAGEAAVAGQVNSGQTTWYGEACSGPLPAQYNYSGASDLENTATNVASTLSNAYYAALPHSSSPVLSQPVSISGHPGWEIEYQLTYSNAAAQDPSFTTEEGAVVVTDTGAGNTPVVFFASVPNNLGTTTTNSLVSSLQLNVVPNPIGSAGADGSPAPGGSPGP